MILKLLYHANKTFVAFVIIVKEKVHCNKKFYCKRHLHELYHFKRTYFIKINLDCCCCWVMFNATANISLHGNYFILQGSAAIGLLWHKLPKAIFWNNISELKIQKTNSNIELILPNEGCPHVKFIIFI